MPTSKPRLQGVKQMTVGKMLYKLLMNNTLQSLAENGQEGDGMVARERQLVTSFMERLHMSVLPLRRKHRCVQGSIEDGAHRMGSSFRGDLEDRGGNAIKTRGLIRPQVGKFFLTFISPHSGELKHLGTLGR